MKNTIKVIITLGIVTYFFPMYSMENRPEGELYYSIKIKDLKTINPLTDMSKLAIYQGFSQNTNSVSISGDDPLLTDEDLALRLAVMKVLAESDSEENNKTLEAIGIAVGRGMPIISKYSLFEHDYGDFWISFERSKFDAEPESVFTSTEQHVERVVRYNSPVLVKIYEKSQKIWTEEICLRMRSKSAQPAHSLLSDFDQKELERAYKAGEIITYGEIIRNKTINQLMTTIFKGEDERQKRLTYTRNALKINVPEELKINVPEDIISLILSFLPKHRNEEEIALIAKAKRKFKAYSVLYSD